MRMVGFAGFVGPVGEALGRAAGKACSDRGRFRKAAMIGARLRLALGGDDRVRSNAISAVGPTATSVFPSGETARALAICGASKISSGWPTVLFMEFWRFGTR